MDISRKINMLRDKINKLLIEANKKPEYYQNYIKYMNRIQDNSDLYISTRIDQISEKINKIEDALIPKITELNRSTIFRGSDEHYISFARNAANGLLYQLNNYSGENIKKEDQWSYLMKIKQSDDAEILANKHNISPAVIQIEKELNKLYYCC
jgi:predicted  nucleic acid-binding Zn-ribbon protein